MATTLGSRPIRVASVARNHTIGGDERRLFDTAIAMSQIEGAVEQTIFVVDNPSRLSAAQRERWDAFKADYARAGIEVVELGSTADLATPREALLVANQIRLLAKEFRDREIDIVDARMGVGGMLGVPAARLAKVPASTLTSYYSGWYKGWFKKLIGQATVALCDAVVSDAQVTLDDFDEWRWFNRSRLVRIRNGFDPTPSSMNRAEALAAMDLPWGDEHEIVGQVSWIYPRKGWETFIDAAVKVAERRPNARFVAVGFVDDCDRPYKAEIVARAKEVGLGDRLMWREYPGPIADVHAALDVFTHLSHEDSQPMAIHEAMAAGTPTVVSALTGTVEIVSDRETGLTAAVGSVDEAASHIVELLDDRTLAARLAEAARLRFTQEHTPQYLASSHISLYRELLGLSAGELLAEAK